MATSGGKQPNFRTARARVCALCVIDSQRRLGVCVCRAGVRTNLAPGLAQGTFVRPL
jgi:hypothetical protein